MRRPAAFALAFAAALPGTASAYCIHNELKDRTVAVEQDPHPDSRRAKTELKAELKPGGKACCAFKNLDCNPEGKPLSVTDFTVRIDGDPAYFCGVPRPGSAARLLKVPGDGTVRIQPNPKHDPKAKDAALGTPFVARVWGPDGKDISGPSGLPCRTP
ncbi:MAG TPA: hypothetical protein PLD37_11565 [Usitatibacteraceae bacterium]|nr:hypothetical protein [Usitatibacteraceae bacterium]